MTKKPDDAPPTAPPVPTLDASPPGAPLPTLPGPAPEPGPDTEAPVKRRRHRRPKAPETPADVPLGVTAEDLARCETAVGMTFVIVGQLVAKRRGAHWALTKEEGETLGQVWTAALAPYLPKIGAAVPWAAALVVTATMVQPRLALDEERKAEQPSGPVLAS